MLLLILKIALAIVIGYCCAYFIMAIRLYASNDHGDTSGNVQDFDQGTWEIEEKNYYGPYALEDWENDIEKIETIANAGIRKC